MVISSELSTHNRGLNMLPCTCSNNIQAPVLAGAACGALQSRVPARVFSPRPPCGFAAAKARVEAARRAGGGGNVGVGVGDGPGTSTRT